MRRALAAATVALALAGGLAGEAAAAQTLRLTEARSPAFPQRAYVLALPEAQALSQGSLDVTENGEAVDRLKVGTLGARSAVVLAIDTSNSMRGKIDDAMAAAREFADQRAPDQKLGIVFFSREPQVVLAPTTDEAAIDEALATTPELTLGTRVYDGAATAIDLVSESGVAAGSVIVLSDGADHNSTAAINEVLDDAAKAHVRIFGVGIRSSHFDSTSLETLATTGGDFVEAADASQLKDIYAELADQQGREYLLTYRSRQALESNIAVAVSVVGIPDVATAAYRSPDFPVPPALPDPPASFWASDSTTFAAVAICALLLAFGLALVFRPLRASLSHRISRFTGETTTSSEEETTEKVRELLATADGRLSKWQPWIDFELDVELAKLGWSPRRIVVVSLLMAVGLFTLLLIAGRTVLALIMLIGIPAGSLFLVRYRARKARRRFEDQLPDNLQVMASALRAGHSFIAALAVMVKDAPEPSRKEFTRVVQDEQLGIPIDDSLQVVHDRMRCEDVVYVGLIATLQRDTGGNTAEVLDKVVETMRERGKLRRLVRTLTAQGRLGGWVVTALPVGMILFLTTFKPGYLTPMTEKVIGWVILVLAALMVALGAYCIRKIVDIKV